MYIVFTVISVCDVFSNIYPDSDFTLVAKPSL